MAHDVDLFQADRQSKLLTGMGEAVHESSIVSKQQFVDEDFVYFRLSSESCEVEEVTIFMCVKSVQSLKAHFSTMEKKMPNKVGASTQPCLTPLLTGRGVRGSFVEAHSAVHALVEG